LASKEWKLLPEILCNSASKKHFHIGRSMLAIYKTSMTYQLSLVVPEKNNKSSVFAKKCMYTDTKSDRL